VRRTKSARRAVLAVALAAGAAVAAPGCHPHSPGEAMPTAETSTHDATEPEVSALAERYWEMNAARFPTYATYLGDRRYDDRLTDLSPAARDAWRAALLKMSAELAHLDPRGLRPTVYITWDMLRRDIADTLLDDEACRMDRWAVDPLNGPQVTLAELPNYHTTDTPERAAALVARYRAFGTYFDQHVANLREGLGLGLVAARLPVERVLKQLDEMLAGAPDASPFLVAPDAFKGDRAALVAAVRDVVWPALRRYRDFLAAEVLPRARTGAGVGLPKLPGGAKCYAAAIKINSGAERDPDAVHALGLKELERIHAEMDALAAKLGGVAGAGPGAGGAGGAGGWAAFAEKAKKTDVFHSRDEVFEAAKAALARSTAAVPAVFGHLPRTPCGVKAIESFREKDAPAGYYYASDADATRPGIYYVNTYAPETRPRFNAEVLAFHESVPGHHLQIALANELSDLPKFRRHGGNNAYVEGWALYTEHLADELGLYSGDLARFGMMSYDAWRASRLVVDTGLHHLGWTRDQAIDFMLANTALTRPEVENEVDRYIVWPGQALGYKMGELEILRLRALAKAKLGARFDLKAFHDHVLGEGAVPLATLTSMIERWVAAEAAR
jgi:uncharacterized protein (DUF885 family)